MAALIAPAWDSMAACAARGAGGVGNGAPEWVPTLRYHVNPLYFFGAKMAAGYIVNGSLHLMSMSQTRTCAKPAECAVTEWMHSKFESSGRVSCTPPWS